ncbi:hypothetical protein ES332_D01G015600v1 [Gossypium tomentosum]|uniref:Uncharacterized protein n=1 Tax=Gossypium tomentosum TaxID=34277 RepID=A0A5D2M453_GOSTO|nr:hypothetical protein ES332_D01G015600v1 [Gossypium tomentosum]
MDVAFIIIFIVFIIFIHYAILRFLPSTASVEPSTSDSGETAISSAKPEFGPPTLWESSPAERLKFSTSLAAPELKTASSASGDAASSKAFSSCPTTNWIESTKANENTTKGIFTIFYVF